MPMKPPLPEITTTTWSSLTDPSNVHKVPWRVGRKVGRTVYNSEDVLIGVMDTQELAAIVVACVNHRGNDS